jgi:hypothetical protein
MSYELSWIETIAKQYCQHFLMQGFADPGHNGPYGNTDTPVRNTAHWLITYGILYEKTNNEQFRAVAQQFADYLLKKAPRGTSGAIQCMSDDKFDRINGLIGQAWAIEALAYAASLFDDSRYHEAARSIFLSQRYNEKDHLWIRIDIDGENLGYDYVFNHQLWFAAAGVLLLSVGEDADIRFQTEDFMIHIDQNMAIYNNGLIRHFLPIARPERTSLRLKKFLIRRLHPLRFLHPKCNRYLYEESYHLFNMYGFALIKKYFGPPQLFKLEKLRAAVRFADEYVRRSQREWFGNKLMSYAKYSYAYNSPAFEYPFIAQTLKDGCDKTIQETLLNRQFNITYDEVSCTFSRNTADPQTLTARIYEYARYLRIIGSRHEANSDS